MPRPKHTPEIIIGKLREVEVLVAKGATVAEASRQIGVTEQTLYRWRKEYGGLRVDQARRLKDLEAENTRLKKLVADLSLDKEALKSVIRKNVWSAARLQGESVMEKVCVNVSGLFVGDALALMSIRARLAS